MQVSADHNWIAFAVDLTGEEQYQLYTKDTATGEVAQVTYNGDSSGSMAWAKDSSTLFYITLVGAGSVYNLLILQPKPLSRVQAVSAADGS